MDRISTYLSGRRAAAVLVAAGVAAVALMGFGTWLAIHEPDASNPEVPRAPLLLNDPPPPVHTGGEPYPPGTFPPELAVVWENVTGQLMEPGGCWKLTGFAPALTELGYVRNQLIFKYDEKPSNPEAVIAAELSAAGVEYESITVRTAEYYDERYDPETFYNWLAPDKDRFDALAALERLGGEVHPDASGPSGLTIIRRAGAEPKPIRFSYQVKLHGHHSSLLHRDLDLPNGHNIRLDDPSYGSRTHSHHTLYWLVGGIYTTFGDDVVWYPEEQPYPTRTAP